jgi:hypothetical protein
VILLPSGGEGADGCGIGRVIDACGVLQSFEISPPGDIRPDMRVKGNSVLILCRRSG